MIGGSGGFVPGIVALLLTYALHSTLLFGCAWALARLVLRREAWRDVAWKTALVGGLLTTAASQIPGRDWALHLEAPFTAPSAYAPVLSAPVAAMPAAAIVPVATGARDLGAPASELRGSVPASGLPGSGPPVSAREIAIAPEPIEPTVADRVRSIVDGATSMGPAGLLVAWALGALLLVARLIQRRVRLRRALKERSPILEGPATRMLDELRRSAGLKREVRLSATGAVATPFALNRSEICVPAQFFSRLRTEEQRVALAHEFAHLLRRDPAWHFTAQILGAVFFFQPLQWLATKKLRESAELLADAWAVRETGSRLGLVRCLAEVAHWISSADLQEPSGSMAMAEAGSPLMTRVRRLLDGEIETVTAPRATRLAAAVAVVAVAGLAPAVVHRAPEATAAVERSGPRLEARPGLAVVPEVRVPSPTAATPTPPADAIVAPGQAPLPLEVAVSSGLEPTSTSDATSEPTADAMSDATSDAAAEFAIVGPAFDVSALVPSPDLAAAVDPATSPSDSRDAELGGLLGTLEPATLLALQPAQPTTIAEVNVPPIQLEEIVVTGESLMSERLERVGFYQRRAAGFGRFFDRRDISELGVQDLSGFFFSTPGLPRRCSGLHCGQNTSSRGFAGFAGGLERQESVSDAGGCEQYFVDGVLVNSPGGFGGDLGYVEAIEIYSGASQLPPQFHGWGGACGAIVVWTQF